MQHYHNLKEHYQFTEEEAQILKELQPRMEKLADVFIDGFYDYIWGFGKTAQFLKNQKIITYHREKIKEWFINLFCGKYDLPYFMNLYKIGEDPCQDWTTDTLCKLCIHFRQNIHTLEHRREF